MRENLNRKSCESARGKSDKWPNKQKQIASTCAALLATLHTLGGRLFTTSVAEAPWWTNADTLRIRVYRTVVYDGGRRLGERHIVVTNGASGQAPTIPIIKSVVVVVCRVCRDCICYGQAIAEADSSDHLTLSGAAYIYTKPRTGRSGNAACRARRAILPGCPSSAKASSGTIFARGCRYLTRPRVAVAACRASLAHGR